MPESIFEKDKEPSTTFMIPTSKTEMFENRLASLNHSLENMESPFVEYQTTKLDSSYSQNITDKGNIYLIPMSEIKIWGLATTTAKWALSGRISNGKVMGRITRDTDSFKNKGYCEHCKRTDSDHYLIIQSFNTGEYKQIATECIPMFVGLNSKSFILHSSFVCEIQDYDMRKDESILIPENLGIDAFKVVKFLMGFLETNPQLGIKKDKATILEAIKSNSAAIGDLGAYQIGRALPEYQRFISINDIDSFIHYYKTYLKKTKKVKTASVGWKTAEIMPNLKGEWRDLDEYVGRIYYNNDRGEPSIVLNVDRGESPVTFNMDENREFQTFIDELSNIDTENV